MSALAVCFYVYCPVLDRQVVYLLKGYVMKDSPIVSRFQPITDLLSSLGEMNTRRVNDLKKLTGDYGLGHLTTSDFLHEMLELESDTHAYSMDIMLRFNRSLNDTSSVYPHNMSRSEHARRNNSKYIQTVQSIISLDLKGTHDSPLDDVLDCLVYSHTDESVCFKTLGGIDITVTDVGYALEMTTSRTNEQCGFNKDRDLDTIPAWLNESINYLCGYNDEPEDI
jgi:hypothetical protein